MTDRGFVSTNLLSICSFFPLSCLTKVENFRWELLRSVRASFSFCKRSLMRLPWFFLSLLVCVICFMIGVSDWYFVFICKLLTGTSCLSAICSGVDVFFFLITPARHSLLRFTHLLKRPSNREIYVYVNIRSKTFGLISISFVHCVICLVWRNKIGNNTVKESVKLCGEIVSQ